MSTNIDTKLKAKAENFEIKWRKRMGIEPTHRALHSK